MTKTRNPWHWIDRLFGATVGVSLLMAVLTAWSGSSHAAETLVGDGQRTTDVRTVGEFASIGVEGGIELKFRQADAVRVAVTADSNLLSALETRVDADKTLRVRWKPGTSVRTRSAPLVEVQAPSLRAVACAGSGRVEIEALRAPSFTLSVSGSGDVRARDLAHDELVISVAGSGDVHVAGRSARLKISVAGSGDVKAADLAADDVTVDVSGSGDAAVQAARTLAVSVAGSGHVVYSGSPAVTQAVAGSGSVRKR